MIEDMKAETKGLVSGRYYLIIVPTKDGFQTRVYDTTGGLKDEYGYPHAGEVVMEGIMELINQDIELIIGAGTEAMETKKIFNLVSLSALKITLLDQNNFFVQIDGECLPIASNHLEIKVLPKKLNVIVP